MYPPDKCVTIWGQPTGLPILVKDATAVKGVLWTEVCPFLSLKTFRALTRALVPSSHAITVADMRPNSSLPCHRCCCHAPLHLPPVLSMMLPPTCLPSMLLVIACSRTPLPPASLQGGLFHQCSHAPPCLPARAFNNICALVPHPRNINAFTTPLAFSPATNDTCAIVPHPHAINVGTPPHASPPCYQ